jgi:small-conductance mechanosensitive channel
MIESLLLFFNQYQAQWVGAIVALGFALLIFWGLTRLQKLAVAKLEGFTHSALPVDFKALLVQAIQQVSILVWGVVALCLGASFLALPTGIKGFIVKLPLVVLLIQLGIWSKPLIQWGLKRYVNAQPDEKTKLTTQTLAGPLNLVLICLVWMGLALLILQAFNINVTALVTGLGIGGIALALAVQNTLSDLLAAFSIVLDKPFSVGDTIVQNTHVGTVEKIGFKSTRLRALSGEQIVMPNALLLSTPLQNMRRLQERRAVMTVALAYTTSVEQLLAVQEALKALVEAQEQLRFDRIHYLDFSAVGHVLELVYYVTSADFVVHLDHQQALRLALLGLLKEKGVLLGHAYNQATGNSGSATPPVVVR